MGELCVIAPRDLVEGIASSQQRFGWFGGLQLKHEDVFILFEYYVEEEKVFSKNQRLLPHRAAMYDLGEYKPELLRWVLVSAGFNKMYTGGQDGYPRGIPEGNWH